jgi:2-keto-3-deoxy-L-rhamnonate aldolase RhmA
MSEELTIPNPALEKLRRDELVLALVIKKVTSSDIALVAASAGYDALYIDLEHSVMSEAEAAQICIVALGAGITPLVRVPPGDVDKATRMLDAGALGIIFPHVQSAEQAEQLVRACRFAPDGERGVAGQWPQLGYRSYPAREIRKAFNDSLFISCMIESPEAVQYAADIAAVDGVTVVHIGSQDITDAMGIPGDFDNPLLEEAYKKVIAATKVHGKAMGTGRIGKKPELANRAIQLGARFITVSNEWAFILSGAQSCSKVIREALK